MKEPSYDYRRVISDPSLNKKKKKSRNQFYDQKGTEKYKIQYIEIRWKRITTATRHYMKHVYIEVI